jgi:hypothetical protein
LYDNSGARIPRERFAEVLEELTERHGGVTAYLRSPAHGRWKEDSGIIDRDEIVTFEAMTDELDRRWWSAYRATLERRFGQRELVMRAMRIERL